jgi:hypothetical protein
MEGCQPLENEQVLIVKENVEGAPSVGWGEVVRQPRRAAWRRMKWASGIASYDRQVCRNNLF